jgi:UTP--glucose-1-phosphate uridylyltransferase
VDPITAAVIPVAGLGTRLLPATKSQPKEMLPVVDVPVVQYVVEELARAGIERVLFVTGRRKRAIEDHFDRDAELDAALDGRAQSDPSAGLEILYVRQSRPRGLGDALRHAEGFAAGRPVVVALGDAIITPAGPGIVGRLRTAYTSHRADVVLAVEEVDAGLVSRYGIVTPGPSLDGDPVFEVTDLVEKPPVTAAASRLAVAGRYVIGPALFDALRNLPAGPTGEVELADAVGLVIRGGGRVIAVRLGAGERRHDVGTIESYCATFVEFALTDPRFGPALRARAAALVDALG